MTSDAGGDRAVEEVPNPETGVGIGAGGSSSFEPEEDAGTSGGETTGDGEAEPLNQPPAGGSDDGEPAQGEGSEDSH